MPKIEGIGGSRGSALNNQYLVAMVSHGDAGKDAVLSEGRDYKTSPCVVQWDPERAKILFGFFRFRLLKGGQVVQFMKTPIWILPRVGVALKAMI